MFLFEDNSLITLSPNCPVPANTEGSFHWQMHCALPFVLPSRECISCKFERNGYRFKLEYHSECDRMVAQRKAPGAVPFVRLVPRLKEGEVEIEEWDCCQHHREYLQSVAIITDLSDYHSPDSAFKDANKKIQAGFEFLGEHLASLQRLLPYLATWTVYPVSLFDVGVVHHAVFTLNPDEKQNSLVACGVAFSTAKQLRAPLFVTDLQNTPQEPDELSLSHELLAEAQVAIFRRQLRLAVLNSFSALETLANAVFFQMRRSQLINWGVPENEADKIAEAERKSHRTDEKYLLGDGMKQATGRSLFEDNKAVYNDVIRLEKDVRHEVAHKGRRPDRAEGKACFRACCEGVRWLCQVAGFPVKDMLPPPENSSPGFSTSSTEPYVCGEGEMEMLRGMFRIIQGKAKI